MEKITREKIKSIIENAIKERDINTKEIDREETMKILRDIEGADDTVFFDLIADSDGHPIRIQAFTDVKHKDKTYSIIQNFDLELGGEIDGRIEAIFNEYEKAYNLKETFNENEEGNDRDYIFNEIGELCDYIQDGDYLEKEYLLEKLADIQNLL